MKQGHCRGTSDGGGRSCEPGGSEKARYATHSTKGEGRAEPPFEQRGCEDGLAGIAKALDYRRPKAPVAHEIGGDSANHHANHKRWNSAPTQYDQDAGGNA
jgi:hypothetical protein